MGLCCIVRERRTLPKWLWGGLVRFYHTMHYRAKRGLVIACRLSVCPSVTLVDHDHTVWKSWKLIAWTISPTSSLFVAQRSSTYSQGNMEKFWGWNVHSTPTSITSSWIESTQSHVILGGGVAVCLLLSAHRAVIFAIAQLSCAIGCVRPWTCSNEAVVLYDQARSGWVNKRRQ